MGVLQGLPAELEAVIETPRGTFVKYRADGRVDFVAPLPSPYNYGCIPGYAAEDGDPLDALVLGPRLPRGARVRARVLGVVDFLDEGAWDPKVVLGTGAVTEAELAWIARFFRLYARAKRLLGVLRGTAARGPTQFRGILPPPG